MKLNSTIQLSGLLIGFILLFSNCTKDLGTVNVTYYEAKAIYGDLEQVRSEPINSDPQSIVNPGKIYVASNFILIGEEGHGIHVIDNSNSSEPRNRNFLNIPGNREFFVHGDFLYAESHYDMLKINIADPYSAKLEDRVEFIFTQAILNNEGETLIGFVFEEVKEEVDENSDLYNALRESTTVYKDFAENVIPKSAIPASFAGNSSEQSGTVNRINYHDQHIYVLGRSDLHIINDQNFQVVNQMHDIGDEMETIFPLNGHLFIGSRSSMEIYDITTPEYPLHLFRFDHATSCDPVLPTSEVAYISLRTADFSECPGNINALVVLDIRELERPEEIDEIAMRSPYGMAIVNNRLYVGEGDNGLSIFDVSDPFRPVEIKFEVSVKAFDILKHPTTSNTILLAGPDGLAQYNLDDNLNLEFQSRIEF